MSNGVDRMDKYLGKRLEGRYEIQELIGMGGMSNVYRAFDVIDQRQVAVKILRDEYLTNSEFLRRFKNESKAIAVLNHPNIVRVFDVSFTGKVHSIVMEYIDGITLKEYIDQQGPLEWKEAIHFTLQILRALQHAHDKGIVHRDIKPQNIMLLQNGAIKVTDFGIARFARSEVKTITDRAIGSVHYISPEQAMGDNTDEKSDIYSVGVMLFEMLTGKLPFEADSPVSVAIKQIQTQAARPTTLNPSIPGGLEDITVRAMQKEASRRYQSAAEMIADIEHFKQDPSIHFAYKYLSTGNEPAQKRKYSRAISRSREEDNMQQTKRKRTPYIPILTGVTFAFVIASLGFIGLMVYLNNPFKQVAEKPLPDLVGIKFETAQNQYRDDFNIVADGAPIPNAQYGAGVIVEMDPKAGREVKVGSTVTVRISSGQQSSTMPNFTSQPVDMALAKLSEMGLQSQVVSTYSNDVPMDSVIYTDPSKDSTVAAGTVVKVYVSRGPEIVYANVPDLIGMTLEDATRYLELSSLRVGNISRQDDETPKDTVIGQDPPPGALQPENSDINVVVSDGPGEDGQSSQRTLAIPVPMPKGINYPVKLTAKMDGEIITEESGIVPAEIDHWKPPFRGTDEVVQIRIYIDDKLYMEYELDFATKGFRKTDDRSFSFE